MAFQNGAAVKKVDLKCNKSFTSSSMLVLESDESDGEYGFFSQHGSGALHAQSKKDVPECQHDILVNGCNIYDYAKNAQETAQRVKLRHAAKKHLSLCQKRLDKMNRQTIIDTKGNKVEVICIE